MPKRWILPLLVLLVWLFVGGPLGSFAGKLASVQKNDNAAYLPQTAESTRVLNRLVAFQDSETIPTVLVFERRGGLTRSDLSAIRGFKGRLQNVSGVIDKGVSGPIRSSDGAAAQLVVNSDSSDGDQVQRTVEQIREVVAQPPRGLTAEVGGQGGILGDFITAFGAIDGILLLVALLVVLMILLVVYRTPVLPVVVLGSSILALGVASAAIYGLAKNDLLDVSGQSQGILFILTIGAATDYSLLLVSRFREELRDHESKYDAMRTAYRAAFEPILASGLTVILGLLCLLLSDLSSLSGLGPVGALGVGAAVLSSLTLLPAILVLLGRRAFWPFQPRYGSEHTDVKGLWGAVARLVSRHARPAWVLTFVGLAACAGFATTLNERPVPQTDVFLTDVESVRAQEVLERHFDADSSSPAQISVPAYQVFPTLEAIKENPGIAKSTSGKKPSVYYIPDPNKKPAYPGMPPPPKAVDGNALIFATLDHPADSAAAERTVAQLRSELDAVEPAVLVGGASAIQLDTRTTTDHDRKLVIPAILLVIFLVLSLLLRSLVAPVLLLVANVLSFGATLGISAVMFNHVFHHPGTDPSTPLIGFVFLVALGIDYSIFLMTRVREESIKQGTHPGIVKGLSSTGGVITSAGVVLAATFAALGVIPILFLAQIAFIVAFGVLLDALIVRSLLVPALSHDIGRAIWWPSRLSRERDHADDVTRAMLAGGHHHH